MPSHSDQTMSRVLLVEPDPHAATAMMGAIGVPIRHDDVRYLVARSLEQLRELCLSGVTVALVSDTLEDASGPEVVRHIMSASTSTAVVMHSAELTPVLACEAVLAGAVDAVPNDEHFLARLPAVVAKAHAHRSHLTDISARHRKTRESFAVLTGEVTRLQDTVEQLESVSITDELTGLYNRRYLNSALDDLWKGVRSARGTLACMIIDIDRFKQLNDEFGHQSGDAALYVLGQVLRDHCRRTDVITRYGGDEFCILMPNIVLEQATQIANRIAEAFVEAAQVLLQGQTINLGISIGVAHTGVSSPRSPMQLVAHADEAMYVAKRDGESVRTRGERGVIAA